MRRWFLSTQKQQMDEIEFALSTVNGLARGKLKKIHVCQFKNFPDQSMMVNCALVGRLPSAVPSIELLKESPPALRTCVRLALLQPFVGRELFAAGFVSC
ncbi:hypothetical protein M0R45_000110 [Rubus argutus]|uniref:Uncharacterized protein n=1 Tax=Rubus argutus TaxID=59490 RepID=A0AAW1VLP2_RUBAR